MQYDPMKRLKNMQMAANSVTLSYASLSYEIGRYVALVENGASAKECDKSFNNITHLLNNCTASLRNFSDTTT